jgi:hypothetical protein
MNAALPPRSKTGLERVKPCGKSADNCAMLRESWLPKPATRWVPQWGCSLSRNVVTKVRTDQAGNYAISRICSITAFFLRLAILADAPDAAGVVAGTAIECGLHPMIASGDMNG